jgi:perosamine synthetase
MFDSLAVLGGDPVITNPFERFNSFDEQEEFAVKEVLQSRNLSSYLGAPGEYFYGGPEVLRFEKLFSEQFQVANSVSLNSWTSGLWAIFGALDLEPGSEVIVSTWTMAATATTILHWGLIPVFVDIDPKTFNIDLEDVKNRLTAQTRAIVSPDIFGLSAYNAELRSFCDSNNLILISDSAQSPLATDEVGNLTGKLCHIGGFSLNYHKHIHTGEGGVVVTEDFKLAERVRMLRNHGEVAVGFGNDFQKRQRGILGMNLRMGEIEAAIGVVQLSKLKAVIQTRRRAARQLISGLSGLDGLRLPFIPNGYQHSFYVLGLVLDHETNPKLPSREVLLNALRAEGIPGLLSGYQNIHKLPLFERQFAIGKSGWPYSILDTRRRRELRLTKLDIAEKYHSETFFGINMCAYRYDESEVRQLIDAFTKVWRGLELLKRP